MIALKYTNLDSCNCSVRVNELLPARTTVDEGPRALLGPRPNVEERGSAPHPVAVHHLFAKGLMPP